MRAWASAAAITASFAGMGCATASAPSVARIPVTILLSGDARPLTGVRRALAAPSDLPVEVRLAALPNMAAGRDAAGADIEASLAAARKAYVNGRFAACQQAIAGDDLVVNLLGQGQRTLASRLLFWRVACRVGAGASDEAIFVARESATLGLDVPPEVEVAAPDVEATIAHAMHEASGSARVALHVTADRDDVSVSLDGRSRACVTPCLLSLAPGDHVVGVEADGIVPETRRVRVEGAQTELAFRATPASPDLAAQQWTARYARSAAVDSSPSMRLLALAARASKLVLISADGGHSERLRGVLAIDGVVDARAERPGLERGQAERETSGLLRELLVRGKVVEPAPRLYERPAFWVVVGVVAAGAVVGTYAILRTPPHVTEVY